MFFHKLRSSDIDSRITKGIIVNGVNNIINESGKGICLFSGTSLITFMINLKFEEKPLGKGEIL